MASKIRVLSEDTINKIAAGEVIENPSSVVKELTENALDAGATEITIEIREGGRQLIRITDNGCGMNSDDALLCLERHATSKLKAVDDLNELVTMGFRGEAIPSIASISKFTLITRPNEESDASGTMVIVDGGKIIKCCPVECSKGTTLEVKQLFFNVPVRKKFQKSPAYDAAEICRIVTLQALAHPEVTFQLVNNQEVVFFAPASLNNNSEDALKERIQQVLGTEFSTDLCPLSREEAGFRLHGFLGIPGKARVNRSGQYLFINQRAVVSPLVNFAVRDGYGTMLPSGKHPLFVMHLQMPGDLLDVNVHPQKREVRLRQEQRLKDLIMRAVGDALQGKASFILPANNFELNESPPSFSSNSSFKSSSFTSQPFVPSLFEAPRDSHERESEPIVFQQPKFEPIDFEQLCAPLGTQEEQQPELFTPAPEKQQQLPKALGTLPGYIIALFDGVELRLIDQRAAHARIIFESLQVQNDQQLEMQVLLIPHTFDLPPAEAAFLREQLPQLQACGLQIKEFGPHTFIIDALPQYFGNVDLHAFIEEIVRNLRDRSGKSLLQQERQKQLATSASRAAISSQKSLSIPEAQKLIDQLYSCQMADLCPHGKTIQVKLSERQIANMFK